MNSCLREVARPKQPILAYLALLSMVEMHTACCRAVDEFELQEEERESESEDEQEAPYSDGLYAGASALAARGCRCWQVSNLGAFALERMVSRALPFRASTVRLLNFECVISPAVGTHGPVNRFCCDLTLNILMFTIACAWHAPKTCPTFASEAGWEAANQPDPLVPDLTCGLER